MNRETCINCEKVFAKLIEKEGLEDTLEASSNDLDGNMCLKCITRIVNRHIK